MKNQNLLSSGGVAATTAPKIGTTPRNNGRDAARHVSILKKFAVACIAALCLTGTAWADNAATIAGYINTTTYGDLTATVSGNTVTVTGTLLATPSGADYLTLNIDAGVTVIWQATLAGNASSLINISGGSGVFEVQSGGSVKNNSTGAAIVNNSASTINISGGTVEAGSGTAISNGSTGALNVSGGTISATSGHAIYNASTGVITVSGSARITSASDETIYLANSGTATAARLIINDGIVETTSTSSSADAIYNLSSGAINVSGGTVSAIAGRAIHNASTGAVTVSGGTVSATSGTAIYKNSSVADLTVSGGTVSATTGRAINNNSGTVNISNGTVSTISGTAINNNSGTVNISGSAVITSAGSSTVSMENATLSINGGTVENTANGDAINNNYGSSGTINVTSGIVKSENGNAIYCYTNYFYIVNATVNISGGTISTGGNGTSAVYTNFGTVKITGGTVSATQSNSYALYSGSSSVMTSLGGNPTITGRIFTYPEKLEVYTSGADTFAPSGTKTYTLDFPGYGGNPIAVMNGRIFLDNFELYNPGWVLTASGANLVIAVAPPCPQITTFPFTEGFENNSTNLPACWTQEYVTGTVNWAIMQTGHSGSQLPNTVHEGSYKAVLYNGSTTSQITRLVMPPMNLSGLTNPALTFYHTQQLWSSDQDRLRILYKTSASGAWTQLVEYTNNVNDWTERTIALPNKSADYYIAFEGETRWGYGVHLDDIRVSDGSTNVSFTATQTGGTSNTANSTGITLTFSQSVTDLTAGNITIANGTGSATKGTTLTGSGTSWTISLANVATQGTVTVSVANFGAYNFTTTPSVTVYKDVTAPTLSAGSVNRTSHTAATIGFTANEAGTAYYLVYASGATAPTSAAVKAGTSLGAVTSGANTGKAVTLTAGARDIYIVVEDAAGNISAPQKIEAAAYVINITFTATQTGGTSNTVNSTGITLTFSQAVTGLTAGNITITNGTGSATKGTLTGSGTSWTINLTGVAAQGTVTVSVANFGDYNFTTTPSVTVYKDTTLPTVLSVTPVGTGAAISGNVVITFSEAMAATPVGTVQLNGSTLSGGSWTSSTVYTTPYSGLAYNTAYTVNISGFRDTAGNTMTANNSYSFTTAASTPTTYAVNFSVIGGNGAISATVDGATITSGASVVAGKNVAFTATPNSNYQVKEWKLNGAVITGNTSNTYTLNSLSAVATVTVESEVIPITTYAVTFNVVGGNGAISATVDGVFIADGASVEEGKNVVFTATPNSNYQVKEWKLNGAVITGNTSNTYTLNSLSAAATVTVEFTAADEPPLQLTMLTPLNNEMDVELTVQVVVTFNKSITIGDISDKNYFAPYVAVKEVGITSNKLIITTYDDFEPDQTYTVTIPANTVKGYDQVITWKFSTGNSSLTGTELMDILEAKLYPNPVNAGEEFTLQVDMKDDNRLIVEIFTASGVLLQKIETADPQFRLTAPDAVGVYVLRITDGNTAKAYRLVVH